jgi:hypothetical protein
LLDALAQIGGPEAVTAFTGVLQSTADPKEIAKIGAYLEQAEPGTHRAEVIEAARQALTMAGEGKLPDRDVAPLFEVFQQYGDAGLAQELTRNSKQWNYYSMFTLARLPDDAGIPTLVQIATGDLAVGGGARVPALQMLAEAAGTSEWPATPWSSRRKRTRSAPITGLRSSPFSRATRSASATPRLKPARSPRASPMSNARTFRPATRISFPRRRPAG